MLSNPPYGKSWKTDLERMGGKRDMRDPRFVIEHAGDPEYSLVTRSSDGQMLFLANKLSKMKQNTALGSRIAEVHNGSSLFTGDAGQGESNIRRWIIENDWLEAIVALPLNMFYNTGIATFVWVLTNRKPVHRRGKVQLIDATGWHRPLRKNLGKKNCELGEEDIARICDTFLAFEETEQSKIFDNDAFGYWKVTVERPLRIAGAQEPTPTVPTRPPRSRSSRRLASAARPRRRSSGRSTSEAPTLIHSAGGSRPPSTPVQPWWSTNPTPTFATPSRSRSRRPEASKPSCTARSCPTPLTLGTGRTACEPVTRSASPATSTIRCRCARWERSVLTSWCWRRRLSGYWIRSSWETAQSPISKLRIYVDTSVIGGCASLRRRMRSPRSITERGALTQRMLPDALHIANAAIAQVDVLVSWNFKHVVNVQRIRTFNEVNREMGYGPLDIRSPREVGT